MKAISIRMLAALLASLAGTTAAAVARANGELIPAVLQIAPDSEALPEHPGFAEYSILELSSRDTVQALVVRLSSSGYKPLFPNERRSWGLSLELPRGRGWVIAYFYLDEARPADVWHYDPRKRDVFRHHVSVRTMPLPEDRVRAVLRAAGLPSLSYVASRTRGYVPASGSIRKVLDPGRGTKCR